MKNYLLITAFVAVGMAISCGGDSSDDMQIDCSKSSLVVSITSTSNAACNAQGSIQANTTGGSAPIQYSINGTTFQSSGTFQVAAGTYTVTARDKNNCTATVEATVNAVGDAITINSAITTDSGCGTSNASITVSASGGSGALTYKLGSGSAQSSNVFTNVASGSYVITVSDGTCSAQRTEVVKAGTSLTNAVMPIIQANCAVSGCHNGSQSPNLSTSANVISFASSIRSRTQAGTMPPPSRSITTEQKATIACWVDDGAPNN